MTIRAMNALNPTEDPMLISANKRLITVVTPIA